MMNHEFSICDLSTESSNVKVPVLETPQGAVWESNAIARYVARLSDNGLFGETPIEAVGHPPATTINHLCPVVRYALRHVALLVTLAQESDVVEF